MSWINTLRTSAEDFGTLAENNSSTGYEPNDHFITEADVEYTQESLGEQQIPDDFDNDDVTIGQTLLAEDEPITLKKKACRPACRRQSVMIERWNLLFADLCRALKKLRDTIQRMNRLGLSWSDKESKFSLTVKQRDSKTRIPSRLRQKKHSKVEWNDRVTRRRNLSCSSRRRTTPTRSTTSSWTVIEAKLGSPWSSWEKSQWNGRIEAISRFNIRHNCEEKIGRRSRYYPWTHWQDTGIAEWNQLYEWFERFPRCWISTQWTLPRYQSTSVLPTFSRSWRNAKPFYKNAEPQRRAAKHLGHTWYVGKRFCKSSRVFFSTLSAGIESMLFSNIRTNSLLNVGEEWESNTSSGSEMQVRTVSQKFIRPQWGKFFNGL